MLKHILLGAAAISILSGCACFDKKDSDEPSNWFLRQFERDGNRKAELATVAYSHGDFKNAQRLVGESLHENPRNQQALLVGALTSEKVGRLNRARQYYEDLIVINGPDTTILASPDGAPRKISDIARQKLRKLAVKQSELLIENKNGDKVFNISPKAAGEQSKVVIEKALMKKSYVKPQQRPAVGKLFTPKEQNVISRFLTLKELAEKDLITKEEFLSRRQANIGGLLPLTKTAPAVGVDEPVPSPDLIIERIEVLKDATENRAITPREFSAERDVIIEALLPPHPRHRMAPKAPARDILSAAKDLRKLEVLYDLNLITSAEKQAEAAAIEKYLGINRAAGQNKPSGETAAAVKQNAEAEAIVPAGMEEVLAPKNKTINTVERISTVQTFVMPATANEGTVPVPASAVTAEVSVSEPAGANVLELNQPAELRAASGNLAPQTVAPTPQAVSPAPQNIVPNVSSPF